MDGTLRQRSCREIVNTLKCYVVLTLKNKRKTRKSKLWARHVGIVDSSDLNTVHKTIDGIKSGLREDFDAQTIADRCYHRSAARDKNCSRQCSCVNATGSHAAS